MDDIRWPRPGDVAFSPIGPGRISHINQPWANVRRLSETFKIAGDMVVSSHEESDYRHGLRDDIFFPIAYLYRQALELKLKNLVRLGTCAYDIGPTNAKEILQGHKLVPLWQAFKFILAQHCPGEDAAMLNAVESVVTEFQDADPKGDAFRYETDRNDLPHSNGKLPDCVCLQTLRSSFDGVFTFLDNWEMDLEATLDDLGEAEMMRQSYQGL